MIQTSNAHLKEIPRGKTYIRLKVLICPSESQKYGKSVQMSTFGTNTNIANVEGKLTLAWIPKDDTVIVGSP